MCLLRRGVLEDVGGYCSDQLATEQDALILHVRAGLMMNAV